MKKLMLLLQMIFAFLYSSFSQNVGIGTTTPDTKAALDIKAIDKGVLFPRLTTAQRDAITSPPDGLHVFNTDERCLNYYDSINQFWNCYCFNCQTIIINIIANACKIDFYNSYARNSPAKKYIINIATGVVISGCNAGDTALSFSSMPFVAAIIINNKGTIAGAGGKGGNGARITSNFNCVNQIDSARSGQIGGAAISTKTGVIITVNNYGLIAAGGGGGGGGGVFLAPAAPGGGGGGGAGMAAGTGGAAGGAMATPINAGICTYYDQGTTAGQPGTATVGGAGGNGGTSANPGGNGGNRAQPGSGANVTIGGAAGKAIGGGSGNNVINIGGGQTFGIVD